ESDHVTAVLFDPLTVAVNCCDCAVDIEVEVGLTVTDTGGRIVTVALPDTRGAARLVAVMVTVVCVATWGAVYSPAAESVPTDGLIVQAPAVFEAPARIAANCCVCPAFKVEVSGFTVTLMVPPGTGAFNSARKTSLRLAQSTAGPRLPSQSLLNSTQRP